MGTVNTHYAGLLMFMLSDYSLALPLPKCSNLSSDDFAKELLMIPKLQILGGKKVPVFPSAESTYAEEALSSYIPAVL